MTRSAPASDRDALVFRAALIAFAGAIGFSLAGMLLMRVAPGSVALVGPALPWLMKTPTWVYMLALPLLAFLLYRADFGWRRSVFMLVWGAFVGMLAELMGTGTGFPFGAYEYTAFLGPKILDRVPYLSPLSWYAVSIVALDLAARLGLPRAQRIVAAAGFMLLWDIALDPAMGAGFPIWTWKTEGFFYGMPAINWLGWFGTSIVIMWGYEFLGGFRPPRPTPRAVTVWIVNSAFPLGICAVAQMWGAVFIGALALGIPLLALAAATHHAAPAGAD
jgi:carotene biosynthesis associated membrane protein